MKILRFLLKNCVLSTITIYSVNLILNRFGFLVPINYFSVIFTSLLGMPGVIVYSLLAIKFL